MPNKNDLYIFKYTVKLPFNSIKLRLSCCKENLINNYRPTAY